MSGHRVGSTRHRRTELKHVLPTTELEAHWRGCEKLPMGSGITRSAHKVRPLTLHHLKYVLLHDELWCARGLLLSLSAFFALRDIYDLRCSFCHILSSASGWISLGGHRSSIGSLPCCWRTLWALQLGDAQELLDDAEYVVSNHKVGKLFA